MSVLLWVAEFKALRASLLFSKQGSFSMVVNILTSIGLRTSSKASSPSAKVNRIAWITIPLTVGTGSWRYF